MTNLICVKLLKLRKHDVASVMFSYPLVWKASILSAFLYHILRSFLEIWMKYYIVHQ